MTTREINDKFIIGREGLSDEELVMLISHYQNVIFYMNDLDSDFNLCKKELHRRVELLESWFRERKINRNP